MGATGYSDKGASQILGIELLGRYSAYSPAVPLDLCQLAQYSSVTPRTPASENVLAEGSRLLPKQQSCSFRARSYLYHILGAGPFGISL